MARDFWSKRFDVQQVSLLTTVDSRSLSSPEIDLRHGEILDTSLDVVGVHVGIQASGVADQRDARWKPGHQLALR